MAETRQVTGESIFLVPFNLFYYFGFVPFRTNQNDETNKYEIKTRLFQKMICAFIHLFTVIYQFHYLARCFLEFRNNSETNLVAVFEIVSHTTYSVSAFLLMFNVWRQQEGYLQLLEHSRCKGVSKQVKFICVEFLLVYSVLWAIFTWILLHDPAHFAGHHSSPRSIIKPTLTFENRTNIVLPESDLKFIFDKVVYWSYTLTSTYAFSFFAFVQGTLCTLALALRQLGKEFQIELKNTTSGDGEGVGVGIDKGLQLYKQLKRTTNFIQEMYGDCMLAFYLSFVIYCVEAPHIFMGGRGEAEKAYYIFFAITSILWILAAQFHYKVYQAIVDWTTFYLECNTLSLEDRLKMFSIRHEVATYPVAFSCRCFSVTYKHLSSMLGVVITYGIIVVQLNND